MNSRTRSRSPASIGSNQSSRTWIAVSAPHCRATDFVLLLVMAWSPPARERRLCLGFNHPETTPPSIPTTPRTAPALATFSSVPTQRANRNRVVSTFLYILTRELCSGLDQKFQWHLQYDRVQDLHRRGTLPPCGRENSPYRHPANKDSISTPPLGEFFVYPLAEGLSALCASPFASENLLKASWAGRVSHVPRITRGPLCRFQPQGQAKAMSSSSCLHWPPPLAAL